MALSETILMDSIELCVQMIEKCSEVAASKLGM